MAIKVDQPVEEATKLLRAKFGIGAKTEAERRIATSIQTNDPSAALLWLDVWERLGGS